MLENTPYIVVGYSGHAYEICNILQLCGTQIVEYCDVQEKSENPFKLKYLGRESEIDFGDDAVFIAIGENNLRCKIYDSVYGKVKFGKAYHQSADIGFISSLGSMVMLAPKTVINSLSTIGNEVIINNGAIVEHECTKGDFVHVAPGAVLLGNVSVGEGSFIGARSVVKQGAKIGKIVLLVQVQWY